MKQLISNRYLLLAARIIIGFIFIFAGVEKIANPETFAVSIENYRIMPIGLVNLVAITLPWLEVVAGILLIFGISVKENAAIINTMLIIFIVLIITAVFRGLDIDCGCFGTSDGQKVGIVKITENTFMLIAGIIVMYKDSNSISLANK